jgi:hypothetical protein
LTIPTQVGIHLPDVAVDTSLRWYDGFSQIISVKVRVRPACSLGWFNAPNWGLNDFYPQLNCLDCNTTAIYLSSFPPVGNEGFLFQKNLSAAFLKRKRR